jgi:hypothetical protein
MAPNRPVVPPAGAPSTRGHGDTASWPPPSGGMPEVPTALTLESEVATEEQEEDPGSEVMTPSDRGADGAGRPVAINVGPPHEESLQRWVEGVLGWQVVDQQTSSLVPPTVRLLGIDAETPQDGVPRILVLEQDVDPPVLLAAGRRLQPAAAIVWPRERDGLQEVVRRAVERPVTVEGARHVLRIGGVAGGVGTTTVALAVAGLGAWGGIPTFVTVRGDAPATDLPPVTAEATAAVDLWARLRPLPGVPGCRAVRIADPAPAADPQDPGIGLAVFDLGVDTDADVVVCRRDAAALEALPTTTAAAIVVVDAGPVPLRPLREATGGRPTILLPWSTRVARAGLHRRVPGSLPGAWLRRLVPLFPDQTH